MDIKLHVKPNGNLTYRTKYDLNFDNFDQAYRFACNAPFFSAIHWRWQVYMMGGAMPGRSLPEDYPAQVTVPSAVLAKTLGRLMMTPLTPDENLILLFAEQHFHPVYAPARGDSMSDIIPQQTE